ncbi:MAG: D-alanyl-D-alanine carboxypeptidase [Ruminococcaceae bacterium]|nr:D-alanyl-D-alanine carboxypeptidase [Oscillospiraceae bacterium]
MKRSIIIFASVLALICLMPIVATAVDVSAKSAVLIEADSGDIIYEKNAGERMSMASTTKIMTALVALEHGKLDKKVTVANEACGIEGSSIYLKPGEVLTLEDLLYAVMLESANDAAAAVACEIAGDIDIFADLMNETAEKLGLTDTHFTNPHGLDDKEHYTTATDLARLTAYAMKNDDFRRIVSTYKHEIPNADGGVRYLVNHNKLLRLSDDVIGVKTGFTKHSGRCLVSAAERDGVSVIAVTLNAPDDWNDHLAMHEEGFGAYSSVTLAEAGEFTVEVPCVGAEDGYVILQNRDELTVCLKNGTKIKHEIVADRLIFPPVEVGDELGTVIFHADGKEIATLPLYAASNVSVTEDTRSIFEKLTDVFR